MTSRTQVTRSTENAPTEKGPIGLRGHRVQSAERTEARYQEILLAAAEVFANKGYAATTMDAIGEKLGGTKGKLYYYFRSKEEIFAAIRIAAIEDAIERFEQILACDDRPDKILRAAVEDLIGHVFGSVDQYAIVLEVPDGLSEATRQRIRDLQRRYEGLVIAVLNEGIRQGIFVDRDPKLMAFTLLRASLSVAFWYSPDGPLQPDYITREVAEQVLGGVLKRS